jgi:hypothetical protein
MLGERGSAGYKTTKTITYSNLSSQCVIVLNLSDNKLQFPGDPFEQNPLSLSFCTTQYIEDIASDLEPTNQIQHLNKRGKKELVHVVKQSSSNFPSKLSFWRPILPFLNQC